MKKEELLEWIDKTIEGWKKAASSSHTKALMNPSLIEAYKKDIEHLKQIKEMIQKPEITEGWIEEKAANFLVKTNISVQNPEAVKQQLKIIKDLIRSLVEETNK